MRTTGIEFGTADEAVEHAHASGRGAAVTVAGRYLVVEQAEADRLAAAGVEFAYLVVHDLPDGTDRVVAIPVNG